MMDTRWMPLKMTIATPRKDRETSGPRETIILARAAMMANLKAVVEGQAVRTARLVSSIAQIMADVFREGSGISLLKG